MHVKTYLTIVIGVFALLALLQLTRILFGWEVVIAGFVVPVVWSYLPMVIFGFLAYDGVRLSKKAK